MKCEKCGFAFNDDDVMLVVEGDGRPICGDCESKGDFISFWHEDRQYVVQTDCKNEALRMAETFMSRMDITSKSEVSTNKMNVVDHVILKEDLERTGGFKGQIHMLIDEMTRKLTKGEMCEECDGGWHELSKVKLERNQLQASVLCVESGKSELVSLPVDEK